MQQKLIEENWNDINRLISILWFKKFRGLFEQNSMDIDDFRGLCYEIICDNADKFEDSKGTFIAFCNIILQNKAKTYITRQTRQKRKPEGGIQSLDVIVGTDSDIQLIDTIVDSELYDDTKLSVENILNCLKFKKEKELIQYMYEGIPIIDISIKMRLTPKQVNDILTGIQSNSEIIKLISVEFNNDKGAVEI